MYTIDVNAEEPIMLLNKQIGMSYNEDGNWDGTPYIDGAEFQQELMYLDTLGKKSILVKIVSEGGSVMEGMKIFDAILTSNTPVDTYNGGVCASIAGAIFMAGRKRYMADYAQFMTHPVSGANEDKTTVAFTDSICNMIQSKSNISKESVAYMMGSTTWIGATECMMHGLCTDIINTNTKNKKYMPTNDVKAMLTYSNNILNETIKPKSMLQVTNKLGLNVDANEASIVEAIDKLTTAKNQAEQLATASNNAKAEAEAKVADLQAQLATAQAELEAANAEKEAAIEEAATVEATEAVNKYSNRIGKDVEVVNAWIADYKSNKELTIKKLEAIPLNVAANRAPITNTNTDFVQGSGIHEYLKNKNK